MKLIKKVNKKLLVFMALLIAVITASLRTQAHAEVMSGRPNWDPTIYDTEWTKAKVKYWNHHSCKWYSPWLDKTRSYIRITDQNDKFINDLTRLEASYKIDGKQYWVNKTRQDGNRFTSDNIFSEEGQLMSYSSAAYENDEILTHTKAKQIWNNYEEANYLWSWNFDVQEIIYLYVWYLDPNTGKEVAASFMPDGAHPKYDSTGMLQGIYTVEGELLEDYNVGGDGIIENSEGKDVVIVTDQRAGEVYVMDTFGKLFNFSDSSTVQGISIAIYVAIGIIIACVGFVVFLIGRKIWRKLK